MHRMRMSWAHWLLIWLQLSKNLSLVYNNASPQAFLRMWENWCLAKAEDRNCAYSKPLHLTTGLLISTIKALALSNPCFTLQHAWAFSWCSREKLLWLSRKLLGVATKDNNAKYILLTRPGGSIQFLKFCLHTYTQAKSPALKISPQ